jgi:hypothetical protein
VLDAKLGESHGGVDGQEDARVLRGGGGFDCQITFCLMVLFLTLVSYDMGVSCVSFVHALKFYLSPVFGVVVCLLTLIASSLCL